jgi:Asp-tRNA(Asn)/Glu-tRNA(Gln) amidotransferase A subunit family amidase
MTTSPAIEATSLDAVAQAALVRRGEVTPAELTGWAIERIEALNPALNAVITPMCRTPQPQTTTTTTRRTP